MEKLCLENHTETRRGEPHNHSNGTETQLGFTKEQVLKLWGEIFYWAIAAIFAFVMVLRYSSPDSSLDGADRQFLQYGLYVGPDTKVKGAIRAAVLTGTGVHIVVTTKYKGVTDGGGINIYPMVQRGVSNIIDDQIDIGNTETECSYVDKEDIFEIEQQQRTPKRKKKDKQATSEARSPIQGTSELSI